MSGHLTPAYPEYLLSKCCHLDSFFRNQFDLASDTSAIYDVDTECEKLFDGYPSYEAILRETKYLYDRFSEAENDTIKVLLARNRQRALVYQKALLSHRRALRQRSEVRPLAAPLALKSYIMLGNGGQTLQNDIDTSFKSSIPYGHSGPERPWFKGSARVRIAERYPEDEVEEAKKTQRKLKTSVSVFQTLSNTMGSKSMMINKTSSIHSLGGSVYKLRGDDLVVTSFCESPVLSKLPLRKAHRHLDAPTCSSDINAKHTSLKTSVAPVYIPLVRSVPRGRAWCSLAMNIVVEDQPVMHVAPYFGEDDRDGVKVEPFEIAPDELEPPITGPAAVATVRFIIKKYTNGLDHDVAEAFVKTGLAKGKVAHVRDPELDDLHTLSENVIRALCDVLHATYKQVNVLAKKIISPPATTPSISRKPLYYVVPNDIDSDTSLDLHVAIARRIISYDFFDVMNIKSSAISPSLTFSHIADSGKSAITGMNALLLRTDRSKIALQQSLPSVGKQSHLGVSTVANFALSEQRKGSDQISFFKKHEAIFDTKGVQIDLIGSTDAAYAILVESFQLLYCRRCFLFDCPLHKVELPVPRVRLDPPQLPPSHIPGVKLPYESAPGDSGDRCPKRSFDLLKSPYCLYCTDDDRRAETEWSIVERLFCLRLFDMYSANEVAEYTLAQVAERIARCMRTRTVTSVTIFLKSAMQSLNMCFNEGGESPVKRQRISQRKVLKRSKTGKTNMNPAFRVPKAGYEPCDHDGPCTIENGCVCKKAGANCEKYCGCSYDLCTIRFDGCRCKASCTTGACPCAASGRECDPELCLSCGAGVHPCFIEGMKRDSESLMLYRMCGNVALRRGERKRVAIGRSDVQGWGLFICEPAAKNELIIEYKGEVISNEEAERRGVVYDKLGCSYLFDLANDLVVDSTRLGNAVKFMNHSDEKTSNCFPEIKVVDGEQRIGLYARRSIAPGEELTFDYKYTEDAAPQWAKNNE